jgi:hypothetical protein
MATTGTNTLATLAYRNKYKSAIMQEILKNALVAEKICEVDRTDSYIIRNPYGTAPTTVISGFTGTYDVVDYTTTNDSLTVTDEFKVSEHVYDFENTLLNYNMFTERAKQQAYSVAASIDKYVINVLVTDGTGTYTTPVGGFATAANILTIMANLVAKTAGYDTAYSGRYLVIEPTDLVGFQIAGASIGYSHADSVLANGFGLNNQAGRLLGTDIYCVPAGTFVTDTLGTKSVVASGHRLFGVKGLCTYAAPRGVQFDEKSVSKKTGKELVTWGYIGVAVWAAKAALTVDITLA